MAPPAVIVSVGCDMSGSSALRQITPPRRCLLQETPAADGWFRRRPFPRLLLFAHVSGEPGRLCAVLNGKCQLPASCQWRLDVAHDPQASVLIADRDHMLDLPECTGSDWQVTRYLRNGILFGALPCLAKVPHGIVGAGIRCHTNKKSHRWATCRRTRDSARHHGRDSGCGCAPGQHKYSKDRQKPHCNAPHRAVAGSAVAHFHTFPSWQTVAV